jgi:hypothetical protein
MAYILLFRAIGMAEHVDYTTWGELRPAPGHVEGKHFWRDEASAKIWGEQNYGGRYWIVYGRVAETAFRDWYRFDYNLDHVGHACYADAEQLEEIEIVQVQAFLPEP